MSKNDCIKSPRKWMWTKCPQCEMGYFIVMEYGWSGNGIPRIMCETCKRLVEYIIGEDELEFPIEESFNDEKSNGL